MRVVAIELIRAAMPLQSPFRTSLGTEISRDVLLIRVVLSGPGGESEGWGECSAPDDPFYSSEYAAGAALLIERHLGWMLFAAEDLDPPAVSRLLLRVNGHPMAKAVLETAVLDAWLRMHGESVAAHLGAVRSRVPSGVSVGIMDSIPALLDAVGDYLSRGYLRIKLKIEPGWDIEPVRAVRERFGDIPLQVDANAAYVLEDADHLAALDEFDLLMIEQPLDDRDDHIERHAELAARVGTPLCLDESITSAKGAAYAIKRKACSVINIKPGRVGGLLEAKRIHDVCRAAGIPVWCGGMLETGIGRAANLALAALPGFTLPGDMSASRRYWEQDITEPFDLSPDGSIAIPAGPGIGVTPIHDVLARMQTSRISIAHP